MQTIDFGKRSGFKVPRANIGGMRLPKDEDEAVDLIRFAIDSGMRYIDTSRGYGDSEIKIGKALKDGYREKVILSTKWSPWVTKIEDSDDTSADAVCRRIEESMRRLDVDYLDYYQIWNINNRENYDKAVAPGGMLEGIEKCIDRGLVGHTGFTTHDSVENLLTYIAEADWCEINSFLESRLPKNTGFCTRCGYCMPCPQEIDIPAVMNLVAEDRFWGFTESARQRYQKIDGPKADACVACRKCEERCTQSLKIVDEMAFAAERFGGTPEG